VRREGGQEGEDRGKHTTVVGDGAARAGQGAVKPPIQSVAAPVPRTHRQAPGTDTGNQRQPAPGTDRRVGGEGGHTHAFPDPRPTDRTGKTRRVPWWGRS